MALRYNEVFNEINDETMAIKFLQERQLLPTNIICRNGHLMVLSGQNWRCQKTGCQQKTALRAGTFFERFNRLSFLTILKLIFLWTMGDTPINTYVNILGVSPPLVVKWCKTLRDVCQHAVQTFPHTIGGRGLHVEIDETHFSGRKNHVGRMLPEQWVFGGICRETKACFVCTVPDRKAATLLPIIRERIADGSIILSDCRPGYRGIQNLGYEHQQVNHSQNFVDSVTGAHTQTIEKMWGFLKGGNKKRRGTDRDKLDSYLAEFMWRKNLPDVDKFEEILKDIRYYYGHLVQ